MQGKKWYNGTNKIDKLAKERNEAYRKAMYEDSEQNWKQKPSFFKIKEKCSNFKLTKKKKKNAIRT